MPARAISIASASVWVARPDASIVYGMSFFSAVSARRSKIPGRERRAAGDHRSGAKRMMAELLLLDPRGVGRVGDIDRDCQVGLPASRRWSAGAVGARSHPGPRRPRPIPSSQAPSLMNAAQRLEGDIGRRSGRRAEQGARSDRRRAPRGPRAITTGSPLEPPLQRPFFARGADVDVHVSELDRRSFAGPPSSR